ncbi:tyrosine-type recombinase/integrase [Endozoicomonas sp. 2B-B]
MAIKKLTETSVSRMPETVLYDSEIKGFSVRVRKTGKFFSFEYKSPISFTNRRTTIGKYGTITVEKAREAAKRLAGVVALGTDPLEQKQEQKNSIKQQSQSSLRLFLHKGFLEVTPEPTAKKVIASIERHFASLLDKPMNEITAWEIDVWKRAYKGKPAGANRIMTSLRGVLTKAVRAGLLDQSPMPMVKNVREDKSKKIRYLSDIEQKQLMLALEERQNRMRKERESYIAWCQERNKEAPKPHDSNFTDHIKPMIILALNTGLRLGEIFDLRVSDLDFHAQLLTVRGSHAKSGQTRQIPLNPEISLVLQNWLSQNKHCELVFPSPVTGDRFDNIKKAWDQVRGDASLTHFRFHDLRHTFGTRLAHARVDLVTIKELMGHESLETTARYLHTSNERKLEAVKLLES